ncbi:hypothetical protein [Glycomyces harbinensis]|uniref:Extracellular repeat, HAF family n=1 Tax=Glycomyces harbinensis TaxID=58114 RepID=A0A1G6XDV7_9ACTN|nr:hypothetical protein [Glycomyces harbinensis]SDD75426.1 hypothetical protein SAMN05216270_10778 [Glycomyces harbinensis]
MQTRVNRRFKARKAIAATAAVGAVAAATVVSVQFASADESDTAVQQACAFETLPIPEGYQSTRVTGMSNDGTVIAYLAESPDADGPAPQQLLYADGDVTEVPMLNDYATLEDVNAKGVGVGWTFMSGYVPYVWRDGELTELPTEEGGSAHAINAKGDIVGSRESGGTFIPVLWPADGTGPVDLPLPEGNELGSATDIGNDGTIVGHVKVEGDNSGKSKPYVWHVDGTGDYLAMPEGVDLADASAEVTDIKGDWASGWLSAPGVGYGGVRWNLAEGTAEMTDLGDWVAVSGKGTVASHLRDSPIAAYQSGETIVELPGLIDPADNTSRDNVVAISADGSLLAGDVFIGEYDADEQPLTNAVTWTCG